VSRRVLVLTYHAVESGPAPLCIDPETFRAHLDCLVEAGVRTLTISELARALRTGSLVEPAAAITFDDAFASVASAAAPLLAERGLTATLFCVAERMGGMSEWPTQRPGGLRRALATPAALAELAAQGFEIGSHGMEHAPLDGGEDGLLRREVVDSKQILEHASGASVCSFAYPYGAVPTPHARALVERVYDAACSAAPGYVTPASDPYALPRVDAHYVRRPELLRLALGGSLRPYLSARKLGARARRALRKDYLGAAERPAEPRAAGSR
jgi:peptidoglycan/xylan/chitin deacetylase (PgdA/CDA1 family)